MLSKKDSKSEPQSCGGEKAWFQTNRSLTNCVLSLATKESLSSKTQKFLSPIKPHQARWKCIHITSLPFLTEIPVQLIVTIHN